MNLTISVSLVLGILLSGSAHAESLRCRGDIVEVGDVKVDVYRKCGEPVFKDNYCKTAPIRVKQADGSYSLFEHCENVEVWTYNPGKGQFWTNLYFVRGQLREMRYGERVE